MFTLRGKILGHSFCSWFVNSCESCTCSWNVNFTTGIRPAAEPTVSMINIWHVWANYSNKCGEMSNLHPRCVIFVWRLLPCFVAFSYLSKSVVKWPDSLYCFSFFPCWEIGRYNLSCYISWSFANHTVTPASKVISCVFPLYYPPSCISLFLSHTFTGSK